MRTSRRIAAATAGFALAASLTACTSGATSAPAPATPPVVPLTGTVTDTASYGGTYVTKVVEVQDADGTRTIHFCEPGWDKICVLLKRGDIISYTLDENQFLKNIKRTSAIMDAKDPLAKR